MPVAMDEPPPCSRASAAEASATVGLVAALLIVVGVTGVAVVPWVFWQALGWMGVW